MKVILSQSASCQDYVLKDSSSSKVLKIQMLILVLMVGEEVCKL